MEATLTLGEATRADRVSFWLDSTATTSYPALAGAVQGDVVVIGGGIVGLTAALLLAQSGTSVVVLEADRIASGTSGYTTAKLTAGHGLLYSHLEGAFGADTARSYAHSQLAAIELVRRLVSEHGIACDLETRANVVYADKEGDVESLEREAEAARRAGLDVELTSEAGLPFSVFRALTLRDQAQLHPRAYLVALARELERAGGRIFERSRVHELSEAGPYRARTDDGVAVAACVVVATNYPIVEHGFFATRIHPRRSYVVAAALAEGADLDGMYINASTPTRSLRTAASEDGQRLLLVGGEGHPVGRGADSNAPYEILDEFMRSAFDVGATRYRWSAQDPWSVDRLPYVGEVEAGAGVFVASGFGGWGMSNGTLAGMLLSDAAREVPNEWADVYALDRGTLRAAPRSFLAENTRLAAHQLGGKLRAHRQEADVARGEGTVVTRDGQQVAISRSADGVLRAVSAQCTHMGCIVAWNAAESSWDCPCHGSRFAPDGRVLHGPAMDALEPVELDAARQEHAS